MPDGEVDLKPAASGGMDVAEPHELFKANIKISDNPQFVVTRDDQRFLVNVVSTDLMTEPFTLIANWTSRLAR